MEVVQQKTESPRTKIKNLRENVPKSRKRRRVSSDEFRVLNPGEQDALSQKNYNVKQLKNMCRHYKQKVSGNKDELTKRIYNYLRLSQSAIVIQKIAKNYILRKLLNAKGPAFTRRSRCVNDFDFFTMEDVKDISLEQFISYEDSDGFTYGFDIMSLHNLVKKGGQGINTQNPYNRRPFPERLFQNYDIVCALTKSFFGNCVVNIAPPPPVDEKKVIELKLITLFQEINELGNYADHNWLWSLNRIALVRFIREALDIWQYRANLSNNVRVAICPPHGNPFEDIPYHSLPSLDTIKLLKASESMIRHFVTRGYRVEDRALGAQYVLCALTLVSDGAAMAMPWLYQSVAQT